MARGMVSDIPMVRGLGPREDPTGMEVVLKVTLLELSERDMKEAGLERPEIGREGICYTTKVHLNVCYHLNIPNYRSKYCIQD